MTRNSEILTAHHDWRFERLRVRRLIARSDWEELIPKLPVEDTSSAFSNAFVRIILSVDDVDLAKNKSRFNAE
jgi:hypothetical protein